MIGKTVGRYRIVAKLGEGGMGSVWKAEDTLLERSIALKFLPESLAGDAEARRRFLREARAASALDHPGIATIHDAGEADGRVYIAMQFVDGETLSDVVARGPLLVPEAVRIAAAVADALAHAHSRGVLHRDISARNIMQSGDGRVIVVDFGLALPEGHTRLTAKGAAMGTVAYMSPEVAQGGSADRRSDVYSLGAVLYEMLTGSPPFSGERAETILYAAVHVAPQPPSLQRPEIPPELDRIVLATLGKDPETRYQSTVILAKDLHALHLGLPQVGPSPVAVPPSPAPTEPLASPKSGRRRFGSALRSRFGILVLVALTLGALMTVLRPPSWIPFGRTPALSRVAVLPFRSLAADSSEGRFLADGVSEALITKLTEASLPVIPWMTAVRFADSPKSLSEVATELRVDALIVGSLRATADRIHVTVSLVDPKTGLQRWADEVDEPRSDLMAVQARIALGAASKLKGRLTSREQRTLALPVSHSAEAYEHYLKGQEALQGGDERSNDLAFAYFERAVELDSSLAEARVAIGAVHTSRAFNGWEGGLNKNLEAAEASFKEAARLNPSLVSAYRGLIHVSWQRGRWLGTLGIARQIERLGNQSVEHLLGRGEAYCLGGLPDKAEPLLRQAIDLDPGNQAAHWFLVVSAVWAGDYPEVVRVGQIYSQRFGDDQEVELGVAEALDCLGETEQAKTHFDRLVENLPEDAVVYHYAMAADFYRRIGDVARARHLLERGVQIYNRKLAAYPDNDFLRGNNLGAYYAGLGYRDSLEKLEAYFLTKNPNEGWYLVSFARDYTTLGARQHALELLHRALRSPDMSLFNPITIDWMHCPRLSVFESYAAEPVFQQLVARYKQDLKRARAKY